MYRSGAVPPARGRGSGELGGGAVSAPTREAGLVAGGEEGEVREPEGCPGGGKRVWGVQGGWDPRSGGGGGREEGRGGGGGGRGAGSYRGGREQ